MTSTRLTTLTLTLSLAVSGISLASSDDDYAARMAAEHAGDSPVASQAARVDPAGPVTSADVTYARLPGEGDAEVEVRGYLARPEGDGPFPGVIVIHEWWGLNDNVMWMADRLAGEGYLALAVDLYEGESATEREGAMTLMRAAMDRPQRLEENLRQARSYLDEQGATRVGSIGWCFGGGWSLRAGIALGNDLDAVVIYYGRLIVESDLLEPLRAPVLGLFGAEDGGIPVESVRAFESSLKELGKPVEIHVYDGADHAFANPSGERYNEEAADDAWAETLAFFDEHLR